MHLVKRLGSASLILAALFLLTACPSQTTISKIKADPARYRNKEVAIVGNVTDSYGALGQGAYEIDDGTGRLWVVTRRGVPSRGARVGAKGRVYTGFNFGGRNYGTVLEETDRASKEK
jgi:starvation-inducible outer membrane lipoprotein